MEISAFSQPMPTHVSATAKTEPVKADNATPERDIMELNGRYVDTIESILKGLTADHTEKIATMNDLKNLSVLLKEFLGAGSEAVDPKLFDKTMVLDEHSPAAAGATDSPPTMSVWGVLRAYKLCDAGDKKPETTKALEILVEKVDTRASAINSMSELRMLEINRFVSSRNQAFSMNANLLSEFMNLLRSIIRQMG
ncbi:MAG: hypothetical protein JWP38_1111 [Herbaspirillum sp.]|jgi:hypothetical protein|nr:hypothetical protein [Herbaspirillum sp.]